MVSAEGMAAAVSCPLYVLREAALGIVLSDFLILLRIIKAALNKHFGKPAGEGCS